MRTVRVGKIACCKNLMRFYLLQQFHGLYNIVFKIDMLLYLAAVVEWQVHKMNPFVGNTRKTGSGNSFTFTDKAFYFPQFGSISLVGLLLLQKVPHFPIQRL